MIPSLLLVAGVVLVATGADRLVVGAGRAASRLGISPLIVGLTVVAFGTSAPEVVLTILAVGRGDGDVAVGNIIGSNIFNVLVILGAAALVTPLIVARQLIRVEVPVLIAASVGVVALAFDGGLGRIDGLLLLGGFAIYAIAIVSRARREADTGIAIPDFPAQAAGTRGSGALIDAGWIVLGLVMLGAGAQALIDGAVGLARLAGVSELTIGLTILAAGTSLPEVAASLAAAVRRQTDMAVGNAIGSCLFNLLFALGLGAALAPSTLPFPAAALRFDALIMVAVAVACLPIFLTGHRIDRWEGGIFLTYYAGYLAYLVLDAQEHAAAGALRTALVWFVAPLAVLTIAVIVARWRGLVRAVFTTGASRAG